MHFSTLSWNSMAGFPETGTYMKSAMTSASAGPVYLVRTLSHNKGPGRVTIWRQNFVSPPWGKGILMRQSHAGAKLLSIVNFHPAHRFK
jgi:hypothetical protein